MMMWFILLINYFSNMKTISEKKTGAKDSATNIRGRAQES
jgi:hypothetical protein